jgi:hypothetical protein
MPEPAGAKPSSRRKYVIYAAGAGAVILLIIIMKRKSGATAEIPLPKPSEGGTLEAQPGLGVGGGLGEPAPPMMLPVGESPLPPLTFPVEVPAAATPAAAPAAAPAAEPPKFSRDPLTRFKQDVALGIPPDAAALAAGHPAPSHARKGAPASKARHGHAGARPAKGPAAHKPRAHPPLGPGTWEIRPAPKPHKTPAKHKIPARTPAHHRGVSEPAPAGRAPHRIPARTPAHHRGVSEPHKSPHPKPRRR